MKDDLEKDVMELGEDILHSERFTKARAVPHHNPNRNIAIHCLETAEYALMMTRWLTRHGVSVDEKDVVRASLLHDVGMTEDDVFLSPSSEKAYSHPREGARIALEEFGANETQLDAIRYHMWPIGFVPPHHPAGWIVMMADKCTSVLEVQRFIADLGHHIISSE